MDTMLKNPPFTHLNVSSFKHNVNEHLGNVVYTVAFLHAFGACHSIIISKARAMARNNQSGTLQSCVQSNGFSARCQQGKREQSTATSDSQSIHIYLVNYEGIS